MHWHPEGITSPNRLQELGIPCSVLGSQFSVSPDRDSRRNCILHGTFLGFRWGTRWAQTQWISGRVQAAAVSRMWCFLVWQAFSLKLVIPRWHCDVASVAHHPNKTIDPCHVLPIHQGSSEKLHEPINWLPARLEQRCCFGEGTWPTVDWVAKQ